MRTTREIVLCTLLATAAIGSAQAQSTWTLASAPTNASWYSLAVPTTSGPLFAAVYGGGIYSSTNLGNSWQLTSAPNQNWYSIACSSNGSTLVAGIWGNGSIYTSTNGGVAWKQTSAPARYWDSVVSSSDGRRLAAAANTDGIYTSTNAGSTWQKTSAPALKWYTLASSSDGGKLAALVYGGGIYTSTNGGSTWNRSAAPDKYWGGLACSADGSKLVAGVYTTGGIYVSTNSGVTWTFTTAPEAKWLSLASSTTGKILIAGVDGGGIYTSTNAGATWNNAGAPTANWYSVATSVSGSKFFGAVHSGGIYSTQLPLAQSEFIPGTPTGLTLTRGHLDGSSFTYSLVSSPTNGTLSGLNPNSGALTYTPVTNYSGADSFKFRIYDGSFYTTGTVALTVSPENFPPVANDQDIVLLRNTSTNLVLTATDPNGSTLTYSTNAAPAHGTLSNFNPATGAVRYTPANNYFGADSFTFTVSDGEFSSAGTVSLLVIAPPQATNQSITMLEDGTTNLVLTAADAEGGTLTYAILTPPTNGALSGFDPDTGAVTYQPFANYRGADSFSFTAFDGELYATGTVSLTVVAATNWHSVAMSWAGDLMAVVDFGGGIYTSTNYGGSWQQTSASNLNWVSVLISSGGERLAAAAQGDGIYTSTNRGVSWSKTSAPNTNWTAMAGSFDGKKLTAASRFDGIYTSTNSGATWRKSNALPLDWTALAATFPAGTVGATAYGDGIYFSRDTGANWELSIGSDTEGFNNWSCLALAANFNEIQLLAAGILGGRINTASDFDFGLGEANTPNADLFWRGLASAEPAEAGTFLVAATTGGVYTSTDSGDNWSVTAAAPAADWRAVALAPDGSKYIAVAYGGNIYLYDPPIRLSILPYAIRTDVVPVGLTFTWANTYAASGYVLQQTSSLNPAAWTDVDAFALGGETYDDGALHVTIIPRPVGPRFYRLKR